MTEKILNKSRVNGTTYLEFDYRKTKVTEDEVKPYKMNFKDFTDEEHHEIRERLITYLKKEGFELDPKPISRNSSWIGINW